MINSTVDGYFGIIILILAVVLVITIFLWLELIEKPRERKEFEKQFEVLKKDSDILNSRENLLSKLGDLANLLQPCKKCSNNIFTVWDMKPTVIEVRSKICKKKYVYGDSLLGQGFIQDLIYKHNSFVDLIKIQNPLLEQFQTNPFQLDLLRRNQPIFQSYEFHVIGTENIEVEEKDTSIRKNRRISRQVQDRVWKRDEGKCVNCGSKEKLEFDHIIPYSKGGSNTYRNIQLLCEKCNRVKSSNFG